MQTELNAFHESNQVSVGSTPPDASPDSTFIYSSNISSSASADRSYSSFASDFHDPLFQNVMDPELGSNGRFAVPDPRKLHRVFKNTKGDQTQVVDSRVAEEDETLADAAESTRTSFTLAVKECQKRRSDSLQMISDCHRPVSLDLNNNVTACSPRFGVMKNSSVLKHCSGALTSPVTPNYRHTSGGMEKGWSSERVPLPQNCNRRQVGRGAHFTFNNGGTLPSKWEDAERWIFGPVNTDTSLKQPVPQTQRRPRSKSGPLGPSGVSYYSSYSPAVHLFDGIHGGNLLTGTGSPFPPGIMAGDSLQSGHACNLGCPANNELAVTRSTSIHEYSTELINQFSMPHSPRIDGKLADVKDAATDISRVISRRDMATQMSPEGSPCSSSRRKHSISSTLSTIEVRINNSPGFDVRDVEVDVDDKVTDTVTRWSRKNKSHSSRRGKENVDDWASKTAATHSKSWDVSETAKNISKVRKEEARISAWENLQKAKAEAAVRKLEMKLEKKRASSMDKIMNKLRSAQKRGQEMRRAVLANQAQQVSNSSNRTISLRKTRPLSSLSGCFTCHAF